MSSYQNELQSTMKVSIVQIVENLKSGNFSKDTLSTSAYQHSFNVIEQFENATGVRAMCLKSRPGLT